MDQINNRYGFVPTLLKKLFTWGLGVSGLFFVLWYLGGVHVWGFLVSILLKILVLFQMPISYQVDQGAILFVIQISDAGPAEVGYFANQWNLGIAEVLLMFCLWLPGQKEKRFGFILTCFAALIAYQVFAVFLNMSVQALGPDLPNKFGIMWEHDGSLIYKSLRKMQLFDTFILRYWVGFPAYGLGFAIFNLQKKEGKGSINKGR